MLNQTFSTSAILFSNKDKDKSDLKKDDIKLYEEKKDDKNYSEEDYQKLMDRIEELKKGDSDKKLLEEKKDEIILSEEETQKIKDGIEEFKKNFKLEATNSDVEEVESLLDRYRDHTSISSDYAEAFPKLVSNLSEDVNSKSADEEQEKNIIFKIVKSIHDKLEQCSKSGNIDENCVKNANLSEIINKVISESKINPQESESDPKIDKIGEVVSGTLEKEGWIKKIGDITLNDIYQKSKNLDSLLQLKLTPNYINYALNLVSYGILLRSYNKFVHNRPIPSNLSVEEYRLIKTTRTVTRFWFAGLVAPILLVSLNKFRERSELLKIEIKPVNDNDNDNQNTSLNNSLFLLFLKKLKNNNNSGSFNLIWIFSIITVLFILLIIMLWYLDIFNVFNFISELKKYKIIIMDYLKIVTLIIIIIPIIINSIMLYLLTRNNNYYTKILEQDKFLSAFGVNFINSLRNIINKNELKNYYISSCRSELLIYLFIIIIYYIFIY